MCKTELWTPAPPKPDPQHVSLINSTPRSHCDPGQVPPCDCLWAPAVIPGYRIQTSLPLPGPHSCLGRALGPLGGHSDLKGDLALPGAAKLGVGGVWGHEGQQAEPRANGTFLDAAGGAGVSLVL